MRVFSTCLRPHCWVLNILIVILQLNLAAPSRSFNTEQHRLWDSRRFAKLEARCRVLASMTRMKRLWKSLFAQVRNRRLLTPTGPRAFTPSAWSERQELWGILPGSARLQLLHNQFAAV